MRCHFLVCPWLSCAALASKLFLSQQEMIFCCEEIPPSLSSCFRALIGGDALSKCIHSYMSDELNIQLILFYCFYLLLFQKVRDNNVSVIDISSMNVFSCITHDICNQFMLYTDWTNSVCVYHV